MSARHTHFKLILKCSKTLRRTWKSYWEHCLYITSGIWLVKGFAPNLGNLIPTIKMSVLQLQHLFLNFSLFTDGFISQEIIHIWIGTCDFFCIRIENKQLLLIFNTAFRGSSCLEVTDPSLHPDQDGIMEN